MKITVIIALLFINVNALAQSDSSMLQFKNYPSVWISKSFSQAVIINLGTCNMVLISGQVPLDSSGNLVGKDDFTKQAEQVFVNIKNIVISAGGSMNNLVKLSFFVKDINQLPKLREVRDHFINMSHPPASTLVEVNKLFRDDVSLEVDATAVIEKKK